jgi:hypothetical protein
LLGTLAISGCASIEIPDIRPHITLPASGDGYSISTVSHEKTRIPKLEWDEKKKRGIVIFSEDWQKLRFTLLKNCLTNQCKTAVGRLDELFLTIDNALQKVAP